MSTEKTPPTMKEILEKKIYKNINQDVNINKIQKDLNNLLSEKIFLDCDLIIDATDNFKTRKNINKWDC